MEAFVVKKIEFENLWSTLEFAREYSTRELHFQKRTLKTAFRQKLHLAHVHLMKFSNSSLSISEASYKKILFYIFLLIFYVRRITFR